jgi:hypothetical protein
MEKPLAPGTKLSLLSVTYLLAWKATAVQTTNSPGIGWFCNNSLTKDRQRLFGGTCIGIVHLVVARRCFQQRYHRHWGRGFSFLGWRRHFPNPNGW